MHFPGQIQFFCDDHDLELGFDWAKGMALSYVRHGEAVGPYYEAALPGRDAFCMRDTAHQLISAELLGLNMENRNMLEKFAENIAPSRDFCTYWEIDQQDRPCPIDYDTDEDFWYNLPANFDVVDAIWRAFCWTGNTDYLEHTAFRRFCDLSMEDYLVRWDRDGDGIVDAVPGAGRRGIPGYNESDDARAHARVCLDALILEIRALRSYAQMCKISDRDELQRRAEKRCAKLEQLLLTDWVSPQGGFYDYRDFEGCYQDGERLNQKAACFYGIAAGQQAEEILQLLQAHVNDYIVEDFCHLPEIYFRYGKDQEGMEALRRAVAPTLKRREYPELSFSVIAAFATGLMGITRDAKGVIHTGRHISTLHRAEMLHVPIGGTRISVAYTEDGQTRLTNEGSKPLSWMTKQGVQEVGSGETLVDA